MDIDNPDVKCIEINPDDCKIRMPISPVSPERLKLREGIYDSVIRVAVTLLHINEMSPRDISRLGEYMVNSLDDIYGLIKKMDEAEGRAT